MRPFFDVIKIIGLFFLCFLRRCIRGRADKYIGRPQKVLIVQTGKLGDMVCTTPMFRAVKEKYPQCKVYAMGNSANQGVLQDNPDVDGYIVFRSRILKALQEIKKEDFDFACMATPSFFSLAVLYLSNIPLIASPEAIGGYSPYNTLSYRLLKRFVVTRTHRIRNYAPREYLRLLEPIGIVTENTRKNLFFSQSARERIVRFFEDRGIRPESDIIVGIAPSAGNKIKLWEGKRFAKVAEHLTSFYHAKVIVVGAESDRKEVEEMMTHVTNTPHIISTCGCFSIDELKALISKMDLFVGVDTGPIYIAEAFEIPTIDIVGPVDENDQPPRGKYHRVVNAARKQSELYLMNARVYNPAEARRQSSAITIDMVIKEVDDLMQEIL